MSKTKIIFLMVLFITVSVFSSRLNANAETTGLQVLFSNNGNTLTTSNTIYANFKVINNGSSSINLADLKFRYYYTTDSDKPQNFYCDHAGMLNGWSYTGVTDKVTGTFCKISSPVSNADSYIEVGFKSDAGALSAGGYIEIQTRTARNDWTNYDMSNDYSFKTLRTYGDNDKITAYMKGILIYGGGYSIETPTIMPTVFVHDKYVPTDLTITLTPKGNIFKGIVGLTEGKEYSLSGNIVTLKKEYLNSLPIGNVKLVFDFGVTNNPGLTLTVRDTTPKPLFDAIIGTATGIPGDTVTVPVTFKNVANAGNVGLCNFYISYDTSLLEAVAVAPGSIIPNAENNFSGQINSSNGEISFVFLDSTIGDEMIVSDGDFAQVTFKIKPTAPATTTPLEFVEKAYAIPGGIELMANTTDGSITIKSPELTQKISPTSVVFEKGISPDLVVTIIPNGNTFKGIYGLTPGIDYTVSDDKVTITKDYLNKLPTGTKMLTLDFGLIKNPTLEISIIYIYKPLNVTIGNGTGAPGGTISIPVMLTGAKTSGNVGTFNFYIKYDKTYLNAESVAAGEIIVNPDVNFFAKINADSGIISFVFLDNTIGEELINSDGVLANIKFHLLKSGSTPLQFDGSFVFGDGSMKKISYVNQTPGKVDIIGPVLIPQINPTSVTITTYDVTDMLVTLTPNGNTFKSIIGLTNGLDYTVSGNTVTILKSYLNTLQMGTKLLTFDFGVADNPVLKITTGIEPYRPLNLQIGIAKGAVGDLVTVPVTLSNLKSVGNVGVFNFHIQYDNTLLEAVAVKPGDIITHPDVNYFAKIDANTGTIIFLFLDDTLGDELITTDGILSNITFKILGAEDATVPVVFEDGVVFGDGKFEKIQYFTISNGRVTIEDTDSLKVSIGEVTGKEDEIVKVPISFTNVANLNNILSCDFKVNYDTNLLEVVSIEPGSIVTNAEANFSANISTTSGAISFLFLDSTSGSQLINKDGVFANINFKLKTPAEAKITTPVTIKEIGAFKDSNLKTMPVSSIDGSINIIRTTPFESKINPSIGYFKLGSPLNIKVELTPNENTFIGVSGLTAGIDYTVSANTVTILNGYLNTLEAGTKKLVFDFGTGDKNPVLEIAVNAGTPTINPDYYIADKNKMTNIVVNITPNGNPFKGILELTEGTDYTVSGNTLTLLTSYLSSLERGTKRLTLDFGLADNLILSVKVIDSSLDLPLDIKVGTAGAVLGDTVTIPVTFENVANVGDIGVCNFYLKYDATKFEAVSALPGSIVINPANNFSSRIDSTKGTISFVFLDNTIGDELIEQDGVFANIRFKIKGSGSYSTTSPIIFAEGGAFGDANFSKIENVITEDGCIQTYYLQ